MTPRLTHLSLLAITAALAGCATFDDRELARVRAHGVAPPVVAKLDRGRPLSPEDVIELSRRGVGDELIIRQLEDHDVDGLITRADSIAMRKARVSPAVIDAVIAASDRFARDYRSTDYYLYSDPYYDTGIGFYGPRPRVYGSVGFGFGRHY